MQDPRGGSPKGGGEEKKYERESSLTQYLGSQEDQDIIRLFYFTRTQDRRRERVFCVLECERGEIYIVVVEKI